MISGNQLWQSSLNAQAKRPLYTLEIPAFGVHLSSFTEDSIQSVAAGGYGVSLLGIGLYGT
jgi:hypothetical protein